VNTKEPFCSKIFVQRRKKKKKNLGRKTKPVIALFFLTMIKNNTKEVAYLTSDACSYF
jgi:hypothetical protein